MLGREHSGKVSKKNSATLVSEESPQPWKRLIYYPRDFPKEQEGHDIVEETCQILESSFPFWDSDPNRTRDRFKSSTRNPQPANKLPATAAEKQILWADARKTTGSLLLPTRDSDPLVRSFASRAMEKGDGEVQGKIWTIFVITQDWKRINLLRTTQKRIIMFHKSSVVGFINLNWNVNSKRKWI